MVTIQNLGWYWAAEVACTHEELVKALSCFADETRQILLEGTSREVSKLLAGVSEAPFLQVESGFLSFGQPRFIGLRMTRENLEALLRLTKSHAGPEVFIHCVVVNKTEILIEAYDAAAGQVLFSPFLPTEQLNAFARLLNAELSRQEMST